MRGKQYVRFKLLGCGLMIVCLKGCFHPALEKTKPPDLPSEILKANLISPPLKPIVVRPPLSSPILKKPCYLSRPITLITTEKLPIKEIIMEAARQAEATIILNPSIQGALFYQARNRPFGEVMDDICEMARLRSHLKGNTLHVEPDAPYWQTYAVPALSLTRENKSRTSISTDIFTGSDGKGTGLDNGSTSLLSANATSNFWEELAANLKHLLAAHDDGEGEEASFSIHKQGGTLNVYATQRQQRAVKEFLDALLRATQTQVLIEAKIVEVLLRDEYKSGVHWHAFLDHLQLSTTLGEVAALNIQRGQNGPDRNVFSLGYATPNLGVLVSLLDRFGTVRTLSSPRLTVLNNQSAIMKVATNQVFFRIDYSREIQNIHHGRDIERATSHVQTIPIGLVMSVHPIANCESGVITISLRPTISRVVAEREDPAVAILSRQEKVSTVPEVQVREFDSVLQVQSGETIVMGGLMEERNDKDASGVPVLRDVPLVGMLFEGQAERNQRSELVIFLRATLLPPQGCMVYEGTYGGGETSLPKASF